MAFKTPHPVFQTTDTFQQLIDDLNVYGNTVDSDFQYVDSAIGPDAGSGFSLNGLLTTAGNLVDAINELDSDLHGVGGGTFATETTTEAKTVVGAINEIEAVFDANAGTIDVDSALAVTSEGAITFNGGSTGNFEVDVAGDVILDGDNGNVTFKDGGVTSYNFSSTGTIARSGNLTLDVSGDITLSADGNDIVFDNGSGGDSVRHNLADNAAYTVTYPAGVTHTLSGTGDLVFNVPGDDVTFVGTSTIALNLDTVPNIDMASASGATITNASGAFEVDAGGNVTLDATGDVVFQDAGVTFVTFTNDAGNLVLKNGASTAITFTSTDAEFVGSITMPSSGPNTPVTTAKTVHGAIDETDARIPNVYNRSGTLLNP